MFRRSTSKTLAFRRLTTATGGGTTEEKAMNGYTQDPQVALRMAAMISEERIRCARDWRTAREITRAKRDREQEAMSSRSAGKRVFWIVGPCARRA
jgi:hypothetical protein